MLLTDPFNLSSSLGPVTMSRYSHYPSYKRVQHGFGGMRDGAKIEAGCWILRNVEGGIRDEKIFAGSGCAHFNCWDAG